MVSVNRSQSCIRTFLVGAIALVFSTSIAKADNVVFAQPTDALKCGALAELVVLAVYYAPEIGSATGSAAGAVQTQLAGVLGISVEALDGYAAILTALGVGAGYNVPAMHPGVYIHEGIEWASKEAVRPMVQSCVALWDQYKRLPGDVATLYSGYTGNGADGVALQGNLTANIAAGKQCLVDNAGRFGTLLGHLGVSYKAWRACRGCCDNVIRDERYLSGDGGRADFFRNAPGWSSCMAVCNGLPHANGDDRYIE